MFFRDELYWNFNEHYAKVLDDSLGFLPYDDIDVKGLPERRPIVFKDNLYIDFRNDSGKAQLLKYDGNNLLLLENPDKGTVWSYYRTIYQDNMYFSYITGEGENRLAKFDGTSISLIPNTLTTGTGLESPKILEMAAFKNKLFLDIGMIPVVIRSACMMVVK